MLFGTLALFGQ